MLVLLPGLQSDSGCANYITLLIYFHVITVIHLKFKLSHLSLFNVTTC